MSSVVWSIDQANYWREILTFFYIFVFSFTMASPSTPVEGCGSVSPLIPSTPSEHHSPNNLKYYSNHLNKGQFNLILINCSLNLLRLIYPNHDFNGSKVRFFIIEILRRSKTSIQTLQICCYYMFKILSAGREAKVPSCPKKLFLGLVILSSKFNQDHNYTFRSWLKICGCKDADNSTLNLQKLREVEIQCLGLLDYNLYINSSKYENWCNVLLIFGYDFISVHHVNLGVINWCTEDETVHKLSRWLKFMTRLDDHQLKVATVNFKQYYSNQIGTKVITLAPEKVGLLFKRSFDDHMDVKRVRVANNWYFGKQV